MKRNLIFIYGIFAYLFGLTALTYFILFVGGWTFLPLHVDSGEAQPLGRAVLVNVGLILFFGVQHTVMARPAFKRVLTRIVPHAAERSTYVLLSGVMMAVISLFWQPVAGVLWDVENVIGRWLLTAGYIFGWLFAVVATFVINHLELFGLQRVWFNIWNGTEPEPVFTARFFYRLVRHPMQLGILIGLWSTPTMSLSHLLLAGLMSAYIFIGIRFEERDLVDTLGEAYEEYQQRVPQLLPLPRRNTPLNEGGHVVLPPTAAGFGYGSQKAAQS